MQRVRRSTAIAILPADPAGGTPGYFGKPDPGEGGIPATVPGYEWYNNIQEEICSVIEGQEIALNGADRTQLRQAIQKMIQSGQRSVVISNAAFAGAVTGVGKAVYWDAANSHFDLALSDGSVKQNCVGFADVPNAKVYSFGDAVLFAGLTPGSRYYLDATTAGAITTTVPANGVFLGTARSATEVFIDIDGLGVQVNQPNAFTKGQRGVPTALPATAGTITLDLAAANNWAGTPTGNFVLANPSSMPVGQSGVISMTDPGSVTIAYGSYWKPTDGVSLPSMPGLAGAVVDLVYYVDSATRIIVGKAGGSV